MRKIHPLSIFFVFIIVSCNNNSIEKTQKNSTISSETMLPPGESEEEEMLKASAAQPKENPYKDAVIEIKTFQGQSGWGYDVFINNSQYVHQPHIPAVSGNRAFSTQAHALKAGEYVAYKIKNNIMPPSVTPEELDSLGVLK